MRLAFISTMAGAPWGGSEELWAASARAAMAGGHKVLISTFDWGSLPPQIEKLRREGAQVLLRPREQTRVQKLLGAILPITPPWIRSLSGFEPDAVLISQGSAYECVARSATRPLLHWLTNRSPQLPMVNLVQFNRPGVKCRRSTQLAARRYYDRAAANLFVCSPNIEQASEWLGVAVPRARVVCNPANLADTSALPWPAHTDDSIRIACVARLDIATKGQDLLLHALARIDDPRVHLTLAGTGKDSAALRALAADLGLQSRIHFPGQVLDLREFWATHHLLALASHFEGTPLAMIEAMLLARPVVVTNVGGCGDWVTSNRQGWIAASPSTEHMTAVLRSALQAQHDWPTIGLAARAKALEMFDPDAGRSVVNLLIRSAERGATE